MSDGSLLGSFVGLLLLIEELGLLLDDSAHDIGDGNDRFHTICLIDDPDAMIAEIEHLFDDGAQSGLVSACEWVDVFLTILMQKSEHRE